MTRALDYFRSKEWAMVVAVITAGLSQLPAIAEMLQGELDKANGKWSPVGLLILLGGVVVRSNVWSSNSVEVKDHAVKDLELQVLAAEHERLAASGRDLAATEVLEAARQGLPLPGVHVPEQGAHPQPLV